MATVTTTQPHRLPVGGFQYALGAQNNSQLLVRISDVVGVEADKYNFNPTSNMVLRQDDEPGANFGQYHLLSVGSQPITVTSPTQFTYVLNGTPTNTSVNVSNAKVKWGEMLCDATFSQCDSAYYRHYYPVSN